MDRRRPAAGGCSRRYGRMRLKYSPKAVRPNRSRGAAPNSFARLGAPPRMPIECRCPDCRTQPDGKIGDPVSVMMQVIGWGDFSPACDYKIDPAIREDFVFVPAL